MMSAELTMLAEEDKEKEGEIAPSPSFKICKTFTFHAAHRVKGAGTCENLHGHTYKVKVCYKGVMNPHNKMVIDFKKVKEELEILKEKVDHRYLNDVLATEHATAEMLAKWLMDNLPKVIMDGMNTATLSNITVWETETSEVVLEYEDM